MRRVSGVVARWAMIYKIYRRWERREEVLGCWMKGVYGYILGSRAGIAELCASAPASNQSFMSVDKSGLKCPLVGFLARRFVRYRCYTTLRSHGRFRP